MARRARVQRGERFDLRADFRRGVQKQPALAVGTERDAFLRSRHYIGATRARLAAVAAAAVPLREAATGGGTQHPDAHGRPPVRAENLYAGFPVVAEVVLVGIDLGVHLYFHEPWGFPNHRRYLVVNQRGKCSTGDSHKTLPQRSMTIQGAFGSNVPLAEETPHEKYDR